jgi:predicted O-methyltransferase YrrM
VYEFKETVRHTRRVDEAVQVPVLDSPKEGKEEKKLLTAEDFENHPAMNATLKTFYEIERTMAREPNRGSFHSYVHIIAVAIKLIKAKTVLEIGSYCGATIALGLSVPSVKHFVSIDMRPNNKNPNTHDIIRKNIKTFNVNNATVDFIPGNSRDESVRTECFKKLKKHSVDVFFIDGDHMYPVPDFEYYEHVLRPGGLMIWDDFGGHQKVEFHVRRIAEKNKKCYNIIGQPKNNVGAKYLDAGAVPSWLSNEFIMQKRWDCTNWSPL